MTFASLPDKQELISMINRTNEDFHQYENELGVQEVVKIYYKKIEEENESGSVSSVFNGFIFCVKLLNYHLDHHCLKQNQIKQLHKLADASLVLLINLHPHRYGFLKSQLSLVMSKIYRIEGEHFKSTVECLFTFENPKIQPVSGLHDKEFMFAMRYQRNGLISESNLCLKKIIDSGDDRSVEIAKCMMVKNFRLAGDFDSAISLIESLNETSINSETIHTVKWEQMSIKTQTFLNPAYIASIARKGRSHYQGRNVLIAYLWTRIISSRGHKRIGTISNIKRKKELQVGNHRFLLQACIAMSECWDDKIPLEFRLEHLFRVLSCKEKFLSIEDELLYLAASIRWLKKVRRKDMVAWLESLYIQLSKNLSDFKTRDVLGCVLK